MIATLNAPIPLDSKSVNEEKRLHLIHRVIVPDKECPKEYALLVTDRRTIFLRQEKTRKSFWLRAEMKWGTALVTDMVPKTLEDYDNSTIEALVEDKENLQVPHDSVTELQLKRGDPSHGQTEFFWLSLQQKPVLVFDFKMKFRDRNHEESEISFYMVPLGMYFKPRRLLQTRETILREYAMDALRLFQGLLPNRVHLIAV
jgi:hypothetical protein